MISVRSFAVLLLVLFALIDAPARGERPNETTCDEAFRAAPCSAQTCASRSWAGQTVRGAALAAV